MFLSTSVPSDCRYVAGEASRCILGSLRAFLGVRDEDSGFWHLSPVAIGQYIQDRGSCVIADAAERPVLLH